jgi:cytoskeletal protein CcmA (bactofilin family)
MFFKKNAKQRPQHQAALPAQSDPNEPSYIGRDTSLEGQINCEGELHIDGTFRGTVRARVCVVDLHGVIHGEISGEVIHVRGRVIGPIQGSKVYIHAGAHVEGDIFQDSVSIENGAYVYGTIRHNAGSSTAAQTFPPHAIPMPTPMTETTLDSLKSDLTIDSVKTDAQNLRMVHSRD